MQRNRNCASKELEVQASVFGKSKQFSIATNTLLKLAIRIAIIIVIMTTITYYHVIHVITAQSLEHLTKYVSERGESGRVIFKLAEDNHAALKQEILKRYSKPKLKPPTDSFNKQLTKFSDGTTRTRLEGFDGSRQAATFIGKNVKIDTDIQRRVLLFIELSNQYGPAWHHRLQNVYFTTPNNIITVYWPEVPGWVHGAKADYYMPDEEWVQIASVEANPERKTSWTGLFYDELSSLWMVSIETPIDYKGRHIATIGHDILLNELLTRTIDERLPGSYNLIFRDDGRLITHPDKIEAIKSQQGVYDISKSNDNNLKTIYQTVINSKKTIDVVENIQNNEYLAFTQFKETGWYFVTVYPKALLTASAVSTARLILFLGLLSLIIELAIFYFVLKKSITNPLQYLMTAVSEMTAGNKHVHLDYSRNDELGRIANAFNNMADEVQMRTDELKESEAFKSVLFESSPIGLALCDMQGALLDINMAYANIIGRSVEETKKLSYWEITPEDYAKDEQQQLINLENKGSYGPYEKEYIHADGHRVPVRLLGQIVERNGKRFIWSSVEDITQKKLAENLLRNTNIELEKKVQQRTIEYRLAKEEAESANDAKSDFLSAMSHELRTPMNAILGFGQLLDFDETLDDEQRENVQEIINAGNHLLELINEVLDLAQIEAGKLTCSPKDCNLNKMLNECLTFIKTLASQRDIHLINNIDPTANYSLHVDNMRFKQVMLNLLSNAVKYNKDKGTVTLDCNVIDSNYLRITVSDTGSGMTKQEQQRLFKPFERLGEYKGIEGTGIGLVITKNLIELMNGTIGVESKIGNGSLFWIQIPLSLKTK